MSEARPAVSGPEGRAAPGRSERGDPSAVGERAWSGLAPLARSWRVAAVMLLASTLSLPLALAGTTSLGARPSAVGDPVVIAVLLGAPVLGGVLTRLAAERLRPFHPAVQGVLFGLLAVTASALVALLAAGMAQLVDVWARGSEGTGASGDGADTILRAYADWCPVLFLTAGVGYMTAVLLAGKRR